MSLTSIFNLDGALRSGEINFDYAEALLRWIESIYVAVKELEQAKELKITDMVFRSRPIIARALDSLHEKGHEKEIAMYERAFLHKDEK